MNPETVFNQAVKPAAPMHVYQVRSRVQLRSRVRVNVKRETDVNPRVTSLNLKDHDRGDND